MTVWNFIKGNRAILPSYHYFGIICASSWWLYLQTASGMSVRWRFRALIWYFWPWEGGQHYRTTFPMMHRELASLPTQLHLLWWRHDAAACSGVTSDSETASQWSPAVSDKPRPEPMFGGFLVERKASGWEGGVLSLPGITFMLGNWLVRSWRCAATQGPVLAC